MEAKMLDGKTAIITGASYGMGRSMAELFAEDEIICEAFDVPENKAMLVNGIMEHFPEKYLVCGSGMAGFGDSNAIHTRRVMKRIYLCGDETTEAVEGRGLMAPRVALCAAHEANMILELILNIMQQGGN